MDARLEELDVLVLDAQATGATPNHGELLEIGWTIARPSIADSTVVAHWLKLSPRVRVSRVIRELTGYEDAHAAEAVEPAVAWSELLDSARTLVSGIGESAAPTVIHFASFETRFLRDWHGRFAEESETPPEFPFDVVCLHALARRLYPTLPRSGIRALAGFLGHSTALERRVRGHVEASAHVWRRMVGDLGVHGVATWNDLRAFVSRPAGRRAKATFPMPKEERRALPNGPGVYRFLRPNGDVLYVGKAASIRKRIASHFTGARRSGERAMEMLTQAHRVDVTETATPLESALLETDEVKRLDPPYNVQLRQSTRNAWFTTADLDDAVLTPDAAHRYGPFPSRFSMTGYAAARTVHSGGEATPLIRARAMGVPLAFAPDETTFRDGFSAFYDKYLAALGTTPRLAMLRAARRLRELHADGALEESGEETPPMSERRWDAPRVVRHLEREVLSGGALLARARWLTILSESTVIYEENERSRFLIVRAGQIVAGEGKQAEAPTHCESFRERQVRFDGAAYDRLRVLTTELRRVLSEGGTAKVLLPRGARIDAAHLRRLLAYV